MDYLFETGKQRNREVFVHGLTDLKGALYLLFIGLMPSAIVFCIEIVWFIIKSSKSSIENQSPQFEWID